jgi:hypothetical protein
VDIDMSGMFVMMDMMKAEDSSFNKELIPTDRKSFDSVTYFKSFVDTASNLTAEEKALLRNATAHIKMNEKEKEFKIKLTYPFVKMADISKIITLNGSEKGRNSIQKILKENSGAQEGLNENPGTPDYNDSYQVTYKDGLLERKLKPEKLKELQEQLKVAGENGMEEMISSVKMNNIIQLPRPAKSVQGAKAKLSADKKTVTINCTLKDLLANPKAVEYRIQY